MSRRQSAGDKVLLLDNPEQFDSIKTGLKTITSLKEHEQNTYSALYNKIGYTFENARKGQLDWVGRHYKELIKYVKDNYDKGNTIRNKLEGIAHMLLAIDKHHFKEDVRRIFNETLAIQKKVDQVRDLSLLTPAELEDYVPYPYLMEKFNQLTRLRIENRKDLKLNMYHLLIAVNVLIPPLRRNWSGMEVWPHRKVDGRLRKITPELRSIPPPEDDINYLWEQAPGDFAICLNSDKIENMRKSKDIPRQIIELKIEIEGVTRGADLNSWLRMSLEDVPRNYVLIGVRSKAAMIDSSYDQALASMFTPRAPTQNLMRKIYVNYWWKQNLSAQQRNDMAFRMRHTPNVAMSSYLKINAPTKIPDWDMHEQYPGNTFETAVFENEVKEPAKQEEKAPALAPAPEPAPEQPDLQPEPAPPQEIKEAKSWKTLPAKIPQKSTIKTPASIAAQVVARELNQAPVREPPRPPRQPFNYVQYSRDYRLMHADDINRKQAINYENNKEKILCRQILGRLNKSQTSKPMNKTVEKYMLYQEQPDGPWLSHMFDGE